MNCKASPVFNDGWYCKSRSGDVGSECVGMAGTK